MRDLDTIKRKLGKLLSLSDDVTASRGEIDNAMAAATRLMAQHNLTRRDIDMKADDPVANVSLGRHCAVSHGAKMSAWEGRLAMFVSDFIGYVNAYTTPPQILRKDGIAITDQDGNARKGCLIWFYGSVDSAEAAVELFEELRDTICAMAQLLYASWMRGDGAVYAQGFVEGLEQARRRSLEELRDSDEQTTALVLRDEKHQMVVRERSRDWLKKKHGVRLSKRRRGGASGDPNAFRSGERDGRNHGVSRPNPTRKLNHA